MLFAENNNEITRTDVENLFLQEMVEEDRAFLFIGECDGSILDDMISDTNTGLFDDNPYEDTDINDILNDTEDDWIYY